MRRRTCYILVNLLLFSFTLAKATLLYRLSALGSVQLSHDYIKICSAFPNLTTGQMKICMDEPNVLLSVIWGTRQGFSECQRQFVWERWNCSTNVRHISKTLKKKTRETAFIYAVTSAGVVHSVTRACSAGNLTHCACVPNPESRYKRSMGSRLPTTVRPSPNVQFKSFGCSDNIDYGLEFGRKFVDAPENAPYLSKHRLRKFSRSKRRTERRRYIMRGVNRHNNEVGRRVIQRNMKKTCRCYGVSGTCTMKTCFRVMPKFDLVGAMLKDRYRQAYRVDRRMRRKLRDRQSVSTKDTLLFMHDSPNYCNPNPRKGVVGTRGRECKKGEHGLHSCRSLCCGRGHNTYVINLSKKCKCKFVWCCKVHCQVCSIQVEKHYCK